MSWLFEFISFINSVFYGEHWFIAWGVVLLLFGFLVASEVPKLVKSLKENKERSAKK